MDALYTHVWVLVGLVLAVWILALSASVLVAGGIRGGLELWAEVTMQVVTAGRWRPAEEESE